MADFHALEALINAYIKQNGIQAITGQVLNGVLRGMVSALGKGWTVAGQADPTTDPGIMTGPVAYIAHEAGTYTHFGGLVVDDGEVAFLKYNEQTWTKEVLASLAATASVDGNVGTPYVETQFVNGVLNFTFHNMKGDPGINGTDGQDGAAAGFGTVNATVDNTVGTPAVSVTESGPNTAKNFTFAFTGLKGETGVTSAVVTVDNTSGIPQCAVSLVGQELHLDFTGLKGAQGDTGSSVDYPFTLVNNLTTNDATQALTAAMGVQLESEITQLEAEVTDLSDEQDKIKAVLPIGSESYNGGVVVLENITEMPAVSGAENYTFQGKNLVNITDKVAGKIKNDSGVEANDGASYYFATFIPVVGGCTISANCRLQRVYYYDKNKNWIARSNSGTVTRRTIPATVNDTEVGWIQIQSTNATVPEEGVMVNRGETAAPFEAYKSNPGSEYYPDYTMIFADDLSAIVVSVSKYADLQEELVSGQNIKTINGQNILGGGDLEIDVSQDIPGTTPVSLTGPFIQLNGGLINPQLPATPVVITGRNLIDETTMVAGKIKNDSGVEVNDAISFYYACYIPVKGGCEITASQSIQKVYYYTADKQWIGRDSASSGHKTIPATFSGQTVGWAQLQFKKTTPMFTELMVAYGDTVYPYEQYKSNTESLYDGYNLIYASELSDVTITGDSLTAYAVPAIEIPEVWEPDTVDSGYSSPIGKTNTIRANWSAEDKYLYYDFLAAYYDKYIGGSYKDGYKVTKRSLGNDCSNLGYEMFEYDFCPANYTRVVMLSAGMNTNETSGIWGVATFIKCLMEESEETMVSLRENVRFIVLPIICPSSFDQPTLKYPNYNDVRINKNFNNKGSWDYIHTTYPSLAVGAYPDSEAETQNLKRWINKYSGIADLYIDCHSDDQNQGEDYEHILTQVICSDSSTRTKLSSCFSALVDFYTDKGYIGVGVTPETQSWVEGNNNYPKTLYAKDVCQIPAIMIEQYIGSTMYGSDGETNNDTYGIKNYVTMLRLYVMTILSAQATVVPVGDIPMNGYRINYK